MKSRTQRNWADRSACALISAVIVLGGIIASAPVDIALKALQGVGSD